MYIYNNLLYIYNNSLYSYNILKIYYLYFIITFLLISSSLSSFSLYNLPIAIIKNNVPIHKELISNTIFNAGILLKIIIAIIEIIYKQSNIISIFLLVFLHILLFIYLYLFSYYFLCFLLDFYYFFLIFDFGVSYYIISLNLSIFFISSLSFLSFLFYNQYILPFFFIYCFKWSITTFK